MDRRKTRHYNAPEETTWEKVFYGGLVMLMGVIIGAALLEAYFRELELGL